MSTRLIRVARIVGVIEMYGVLSPSRAAIASSVVTGSVVAGLAPGSGGSTRLVDAATEDWAPLEALGAVPGLWGLPLGPWDNTSAEITVVNGGLSTGGNGAEGTSAAPTLA
ncbi:hypothetical protein FRC08_006473 [Ceratobasidium sp. 394]|nr:hypothetical protein FRC08_006473 [Ceratobasidium sp. 394]